jgi:acyl carrier protein
MAINPVLNDQLTSIFRDVFNDDDLKLTPELTAEQVDGWDSLGHVRLIVAIEKALNIRLSTTEITGLANVGQLVQVIENKVKR